MHKIDLPQEEIVRIFQEMIAPQVLKDAKPQEEKRACIMGGQPGSGKSSLAVEVLKSRPGMVFINGDDLRSHHPKYFFYLQEDDKEVADLTQPVANMWVEMLIDECVVRGLNVLVEGTMRKKDAPLATAQKLKDAGYVTDLIVLSTPRELSLASLRSRYEELKKMGMVARFTKTSSHDEAFDNIGTTLTELLAVELFNKCYVFHRTSSGFREYVFECQEIESIRQVFHAGRAPFPNEIVKKINLS